MQVGKIIVNIVIGFIPDLAIAWAYMKLTNGGETEFIVALIGLQAIYLFLWLKQAVWAWLLFWLYSKRTMSRAFETFFKDNNFPRPGAFTQDLDDYLPEIFDSEMVPIPARLKASFEFGSLNGLRIGQRYSTSLMMSIASKSAIDRYARYAPESFLAD